MQVLAPILLAWVLSGARGVIRTPLEAFRPSGEIHIRRPDKLPLLPHRRTTLPPKSGLKILYQTGFYVSDVEELAWLMSDGEFLEMILKLILQGLSSNPYTFEIVELCITKVYQRRTCKAFAIAD
ncbi:putative argos [Operophtera brumata]|uniref:Putative argos n=1 Tax=Operophtera brumata TaxID=104452 RepID=A0A0L7L8A2_OPEBR|nr:putative argos [Operophtera brumata]